ncbi:MAG: nucleoside monophosphate kinase [Bacteriovoracaceae bacterium]|jgi:adenylate kinase|nr:nucleoside monophosphate kinase [Bacteriovoracaceae bacterium]
MKKQLVFLGAPGSGKGTQASKLVGVKGYNHVSTGDLLRAEVAEGSDLGKRVSEIMSSGSLVSDEIVLELLKKNCDLGNGVYIFDGFPRNIDQAKALDAQVLSEAPYQAIYFKVDNDKLIGRLTSRRTCGDCKAIYNLISKLPKVSGVCDECGGSNLEHRKDDTEDVIRNRLEVFEGTIKPVLDYYESKNNLTVLDAMENIDDVFHGVEGALS